MADRDLGGGLSSNRRAVFGPPAFVYPDTETDVSKKLIAVESLLIEGESNESNQMESCDNEQDCHPPFALFCPDLQRNVGGPYATAHHAYEAKEAMLRGKMVPYDSDPSVTWTAEGNPSPWYDREGD